MTSDDPEATKKANERFITEQFALLYEAWCVIANVSGGDWKQQHDEWQAAAERWRGRWHKTLLQPDNLLSTSEVAESFDGSTP